MLYNPSLRIPDATPWAYIFCTHGGASGCSAMTTDWTPASDTRIRSAWSRNCGVVNLRPSYIAYRIVASPPRYGRVIQLPTSCFPSLPATNRAFLGKISDPAYPNITPHSVMNACTFDA